MIKCCCSEVTGQGVWDSLYTFLVISPTFTQTVLIIYYWYSVLCWWIRCVVYHKGSYFVYTEVISGDCQSCDQALWGRNRQGWTCNCNFTGSQKKTPLKLKFSDHNFIGSLFANFKLRSVSSSALRQPTAYRPRLLLVGSQGSGQSSHLAPALLHHLDKLPVHRLDLPTLYSVSAKTPEESCAQVPHD